MSILKLQAAASEAGLPKEADSISSQRAAFWGRIDSVLWRRLTRDARSEVVTDGNVSLVRAFEQKCKQVRKTVWQKIRRAEIEGVIFGPNGAEFEPEGSKNERYLMWSEGDNVDIQNEAQRRVSEEADVELLGKSLVLIRNAIPQILKASHEDYMPRENPIISIEQTRAAIENGIGSTFNSLYRSELTKGELGVDVLYELETFWREQVGFATLDGDAICALTTHAKMPAAWIVIIPHDHRLMREKPAQLNVDTSHDMNLLYVKPFDCTEKWYGVAGPHELVHLHDFATGRESKRPSRTEYIDGENRAFSAEITSADLITKGDFSKIIQEFVRHRKFTLDDIIQLGIKPDAMIDALAASVDSHLKMPQPRSFSEANMRAGLYLIACGFAVARNDAVGEQDPSVLQKRVIETLYERQGVLPKK